jgi:hypothetical protein
MAEGRNLLGKERGGDLVSKILQKRRNQIN